MNKNFMTEELLAKLPAAFRTILVAFIYWWDDLFMQAVMNLLWSLSWFTVILGPPLTFGIHYVQSEYVRGENPGLRGMWEGARIYFIKSWQWMLTNLILLFILFASVDAYRLIEAGWASIARALTIAIGVVWVIIQFYAVPLLMAQEQKSLRLAWRNALMMTLASPGYLLVLFVFLALFGVISALLIFPVILGYTTLLSLLANQAVRDRLAAFRQILSDDEK
jgi:hypothetical protein